jgi:hypothetical protein
MIQYICLFAALLSGAAVDPIDPQQDQNRPRLPIGRAVRICQDSVTNRLYRDGYRYVEFGRVVSNNNPGWNDWVTGSVSGSRGRGPVWFSFSCSVDFSSGRVRSVDLRRR